LVRLKQFDYVPPFRGRAVHFTQRDLSFDELKIDFDELAKRKAAEYEKLESVIEFARTARCRQRAVLDYFGDPNVSDCTRCDRCDPTGKSMGASSPANPLNDTSLMSGDKLNGEQKVDYDLVSFSRGIRIVLSGIARMHGRFGKAMIAQMLGGSNNKKIQQWKLNRLSTYGMLGGLKQPQLCDLIDAVIEAGLASQTEVDDRRPTVKLTPDGEAVMRATEPIPAGLRVSYPLSKRLAFISSAIERGDVSAEASVGNIAARTNDSPSANDANETTLELLSTDATQPIALDQDLVDRLKRWRGKTSAALGIPAYRVVSNATIERIATKAPRSIAELEAIQGIGLATIEQFGHDLMQMILDHVSNADPAVQQIPATASTVESPSLELPPAAIQSLENPVPLPEHDVSSEDAYWTWRLFRDGYSCDQISLIRGRDSSEIASDLAVAAKAGHAVNPAWKAGTMDPQKAVPRSG